MRSSSDWDADRAWVDIHARGILVAVGWVCPLDLHAD